MIELLPQPETNLHNLGMAAVALETSPQIERANEVANSIDPEGRLPDVKVIPDPEHPMGKWALVNQPSLLIRNGEVIGSCTLVSDNKEHVRWFGGIEVNDQYRGKGFGSAAYKAAIVEAMKDGYDFRTHDWSQTEAAKNVWERLAEKGVASVERPFKNVAEGRFDGSYVVKAVK